MVLTTFALLVAAQANPLSCPIMGHPVTKPTSVFVYNGIRVETCCAGCDEPFAKDPQKALKNEKMKGKTLGLFLFDPVSGARVDSKKAVAFAEHNGIRYPFSSEANKAAFEAEPKKFGGFTNKEVLFCGLMGKEIKSVEAANGYVDQEGVRYYVCCAGCLRTAKQNPAAAASAASSKAVASKANKVKA